VRGIFKVIESTHFHGAAHRQVTLQSQQVTSEMFAAEIKIIVNDPACIGQFALGTEMTVEILQARRSVEAPAAKKV
jgi:hypothetical protein